VKGQALTEYALVLALASGAAWIRQTVGEIDPRTATVALAAGVALLLFLVVRR